MILHLVGAPVISSKRTDRVNRPLWHLNVGTPELNPVLGPGAVNRPRDLTERRAEGPPVAEMVRRENQISGEVRQFFWQVLANVIRHVSACPGLFAARRQGPDSHDRITISASLTTVSPNSEMGRNCDDTYLHVYLCV